MHQTASDSGDPAAPPAAPAYPAEDFRAAWVAELELLELDVARAELLLAVESGDAFDDSELVPWRAPELRAPLPSDLEPRARLVLERQLAVAHRLTERLTRTGRQQAYTDRMHGNAHVDIPVYVDLRA